MGYLDNDTIVVDAILTKHGRKLLSDGFAINPTHFALADDGVDYTLWNTSSPSGSSGYDDYITSLPMVEAVPDDQTLMRYKLISLNQNTQYMPTVTLANVGTAPYALTLDNSDPTGAPVVLTPQVTNWTFGDSGQFIFKVSDRTSVQLTHDGLEVDVSGTAWSPPAQQGIPQYVEVVNATFLEIDDKTVQSKQTVHITIEHVASGALTTATVEVSPA